MTENDLLFCDTETDGLWKVGFDEFHPGQPRPVQIAFARYTPAGEEVFAASFLVSPLPSWPELSKHSVSIHGIQEATRRAGLDPQQAGDILAKALPASPANRRPIALGGHNVGFDLLVLRAFYFDLGSPDVADMLLQAKTVDTMQMGIDVARLPRRDGEAGYKRPSLTELHTHLFGAGFDGAHDALADVRASARCYFEMKHRYQAPDAAAIPPRTDGGRDPEEVRRVIERCQTAPKESAKEEEVVRDYTARFEKYGDRFLASDKVWSWLCRIANRA
jgi:hypothetical protein